MVTLVLTNPESAKSQPCLELTARKVRIRLQPPERLKQGSILLRLFSGTEIAVIGNDVSFFSGHSAHSSGFHIRGARGSWLMLGVLHGFA